MSKLLDEQCCLNTRFLRIRHLNAFHIEEYLTAARLLADRQHGADAVLAHVAEAHESDFAAIGVVGAARVAGRAGKTLPLGTAKRPRPSPGRFGANVVSTAAS
jgi:hypothetical protein